MPDDRWLAAVWPFVRAQLPAAPAAVAEIGCGPLGGFVPVLRSAGYEAVGIDPEAPEGPWYRQAEFEDYETGPVVRSSPARPCIMSRTWATCWTASRRRWRRAAR